MNYCTAMCGVDTLLSDYMKDVNGTCNTLYLWTASSSTVLVCKRSHLGSELSLVGGGRMIFHSTHMAQTVEWQNSLSDTLSSR